MEIPAETRRIGILLHELKRIEANGNFISPGDARNTCGGIGRTVPEK
jgi:hypothetical protein